MNPPGLANLTISIPHVGLVVFDAILLQEHPELLLERPCPVMFFLLVNVGTEETQIARVRDNRMAKCT